MVCDTKCKQRESYRHSPRRCRLTYGLALSNNSIIDVSRIDDPVSTTAILIIAVGLSALIILLMILGLLYLKRKKKRRHSTGDVNAHGHKLTEPFFASNKRYKKPDIIITEPTSDVADRTSGNASLLEVTNCHIRTRRYFITLSKRHILISIFVLISFLGLFCKVRNSCGQLCPCHAGRLGRD